MQLKKAIWLVALECNSITNIGGYAWQAGLPNFTGELVEVATKASLSPRHCCKKLEDIKNLITFTTTTVLSPNSTNASSLKSSTKNSPPHPDVTRLMAFGNCNITFGPSMLKNGLALLPK